MEEDILNKILRRTRESSGIPPGEADQYALVGESGPEAIVPMYRDGIRKSLALMSGVTTHTYNVSGGSIEELNEYGRGSTPGYSSVRPLGDFVSRPGQPAQPISQDDTVFGMKDPAGLNSGTTVTITIGTIIASGEDEGRAAAKAFKEEMARRGVQFSR